VPDIIQLLPDSVANQIAAGEVIQRPASVVKELVENAIDAGANQVTVNIKDAGRTLIQVSDNGCGMSATDARMAFERHATSKIRSASDLFAIRTMGFRGEALASIAAVADVELSTQLHDEEIGTYIHIGGSRLSKQEPVTCACGSNFMIKNLFFNVPARRKFLKGNPTELKHIINEIQRISLANPGIGISLFHNQQAIYELAGGEQLSQTDVAEIISVETGRQVKAIKLDPKKWEEKSKQSGMNEYARDTLLRMFDYYDHYGLKGNPKILEMLLGWPPTKFSTFIRRQIHSTSATNS
jgi:DNA mismatch repair protein MutL